jgi:hypothetical protein
MVSVDFFTVPTIRFQILYVFLVVERVIGTLRRECLDHMIVFNGWADSIIVTSAGSPEARSRPRYHQEPGERLSPALSRR